ncbi:MAG: hypothetical protein P9L99_07685 [Candidatus Lernaella stagnicola]|nr:hypothetical protein [Candidatus Lernaella stagnicola]
MRLADRAAQAVGAGRHDVEVHVVGHQAIGPHLDAALFELVGHQIEVGAVFVTEKGLPAAIATLRDVVRDVRNNNAGDSRHKSTVHQNARDVNN